MATITTARGDNAYANAIGNDKDGASNTQRKIRLRSMPDENGESMVYEIQSEAVGICEFLKHVTEDCDGDYEEEEEDDVNGGGDGDDEIQEIEIPRVRGKCLGKVVDFMKHNAREELKKIPKFLEGDSFNKVIDQPWYQQFMSDDNLGVERKSAGAVERDHEMLFELVQAANFLGIDQLLDLVILKISYMVVGKNEEEIRDLLGLPAMTEADKVHVQNHHSWIFEDVKY